MRLYFTAAALSPEIIKNGRRGMTLVETTIAMAVLAIAMVGLLSAILSSMRLRRLNEEKSLARNAAERTMSAIRGVGSIVEAYNRFGGGSPGETFEVFGLAQPSAGTPAGRVVFWRMKDGSPPDPLAAAAPAPEEIAEAMHSLGVPFPLPFVGNEGPFSNDYLDTNADNAVGAGDDPSVVPVTVRIRWKSRSGVITEYFSTVIGRR